MVGQYDGFCYKHYKKLLKKVASSSFCRGVREAQKNWTPFFQSQHKVSMFSRGLKETEYESRKREKFGMII